MPDEPKFQAHPGPLFDVEFENYPEDQQKAIYAFVQIYNEHGLEDITKYPGKIGPTWKAPGTAADYEARRAYALEHQLWHYHLGIPEYKKSPHGDWLTSDFVLHFQKDGKYSITLVDTYWHTWEDDGSFYVPPLKYLKPKP